MKINNTGCALCESTWGDYYQVVEGTKLFFCCDVCASLYQEIIDKIKEFYYIKTINSLSLTGNSKERNFTVETEKNTYNGRIKFFNGHILDFINQS